MTNSNTFVKYREISERIDRFYEGVARDSKVEMSIIKDYQTLQKNKDGINIPSEKILGDESIKWSTIVRIKRDIAAVIYPTPSKL